MKISHLSTKEAAKYLGLAPVTLAKWRCYSTPNKPAWIDYGRTIKYRLEDLDAWVESNRHEVATSEICA